jgi:hypothetical protein
MERHIAKRLGLPCAVISAPVHVQDFPARYAPVMGFEGANVLFDTLVHPLVMGLEEHLLHMFRDDFEFHDEAGPSHLHGAGPSPLRLRGAGAEPGPRPLRPGPRVRPRPRRPACGRTHRLEADAEKELKKIPFFVRGKARRNTEAFAAERGVPRSRRDALRCKSPFLPLSGRPGPRRHRHAGRPSGRVGGARRARAAGEIPGLKVSLHAASEWAAEPAALEAAKAAIAEADIIVACMLFIDDHIRAIKPALEARRDSCDAMICVPLGGGGHQADPMGKLDMSAPQKGPLALLKRLRGKPKGGAGSSGEGQMKMLRRLPKILKYIPGKAQDLRAYFLTMPTGWRAPTRTSRT